MAYGFGFLAISVTPDTSQAPHPPAVLHRAWAGSPRSLRAGRSRRHAAELAVALALALAGCADKMIPNTDVPDTESNRLVLRFVEKYRHAVEGRDVGAILKLTSPHYFDDNGTPQGMDDVDHDRLKERLLAWKNAVSDVRYEIRYRKVSSKGHKIFVDFTYSGSFEIEAEEGTRWARRLADTRLTLTRLKDKEGFLIVSGL